MNKIVASLGLAAVGATGVQTVYADSGLQAPSPKLWNVSASLRGFYDDNINTAPDGGGPKVSSFGFDVSPSVGLKWGDDNTRAEAQYTYTFRYYEKRPAGNVNKYDQDHVFRGALDHAFNERYQIGVHDSFVVGQEPDLIRGTLPNGENQRIPGS